MTRKDYVLVAEAINSVRCETREAGRDDLPVFSVAHRLAHRLKLDNPAFERARFMAACGFPAGK